ncbi:DHA2 family efflux MFS transporter permease subunit [Parendozoicomonas haliclonae]|uniref:Multidrug export protein EmrB n=1 Tax=Parendozoicomonas haliclonae TaxID=1960125 RepID=A0A1X7ADS8_9GAMM|nr:DHA2 family efflux MFS transporter permease subunit [Parendozoicomonas haliclonae]SMA32656.1 Multidrug export protein EmrB [Parendozoicomonas haliclonae]
MSSEPSRGAITATLVITSMMVLIDTTIANVALPKMMGTLGATSNQITWVLTSYTMAEAVMIPLAGYFTRRIGERKLLLISIVGFIITSALSGQADSLGEIVFFRILQGLFGASAVPLSQSLLVQVYPKEERGKAMAIFTVGVLFGPILGPVIGGVITQHMSWRWVFYVNAPVGLICLYMIYRNIKISNIGKATVDWLIAISMAVGIGLLQMVLSVGNQDNWFNSNFVLYSFVLSLVALTFFIGRSIITKASIAPVWMLANRNLAVACFSVAGFAVCTFGILQLQPMMLQELLNYPVETSGLVMSPRGIASALLLFSIASRMDKIDARILIFIGLCLNFTGVWFMTQYSLQASMFWMIFPEIIQGAGMGMLFASLSRMAFATLPPELSTDGAALFSLCRTLGASFGIAMTNTYFSRVKQAEWNSLGGALSPDNPIFQQFAESQHAQLTDPTFLQQIANMVERQSTMLAFVISFGMFLYIYLINMLLIPLFKKPSEKEPPSQVQSQTKLTHPETKPAS